MKDSHDRKANAQTARPLQEIESYNGITILVTFGLLLILIGFVVSFTCFKYVISNPYIVDGKRGLYISFIENDLWIPFILSALVCLCGVFICWYDAYKHK